MLAQDDSERLVGTIRQTISRKRQLSIIGHGSKSRYIRPEAGDRLETRDHRGVIEYRPEELTISVRAGTPLADVESALDAENQMLACDPPRFAAMGTIGGAMACGLSGPGRPWYGNFRDAVLGVEVVNGLGERLRFGGSVMKNVAGFDVSRLFVGSLGVFGLILSVNLRVYPKPAVEESLELELDPQEAQQLMRTSIAKPTPISATCYHAGRLQVRLSGNRASVSEARESLDASVEISNKCWSNLRDHSHPFFQTESRLRRAWLARGVFAPDDGEPTRLTEWGGGQVWLTDDGDELQNLGCGGSIESFDRAQAAPAQESKYTRRLRQAFDPNRIFNSDLRL